MRMYHLVMIFNHQLSVENLKVAPRKSLTQCGFMANPKYESLTHRSHSLLCQWAFYVVRVQSMIARWVSMRIDWLSCGDYRLWMGYDDRRPIKLEEELGCFIKINGLKICASLRIFLENSTCSITQQAHMHILLVKLKRKKITFFYNFGLFS